MTVQSTPEASEAPVTEVEAIVDATTPETEVTDQAAVEDAPEVGTSGEDTVLERFKLEDIEDPAVREHVERYVKQVQGDYTRKTTTLAEQRKAVEAEAAQIADIRDTFTKLESEDTRDDAIAALVEKYGYTFEEAEAEAEAVTDEAEGAEFRDPRVDELLAAQEADRQAQAEADAEAEQEVHNDTIMDHVDDALGTFAQTQGVEELRPGQRRQIIAIAAALPRLEGDLPNMEAAIAEYEAERAAEVDGYLASKRGTVPDVTGSTGTPSFDPRDTKQRLAHANRIAESRLASHR